MPTVLVHSRSPNEKGDASVSKYEVNAGQILYDELERQGLNLPHGCLAGSCGSCRIHVINGLENLSAMGAVETDTVNHIKDSHPGKTVRLACRAKVQGDVEFIPIK